VLKGRGIGLRYPLSGCQLVMSDEHDQAVVHWLDRSAGDTQWLIRFLALDSGWVGAVAAEGTNWTVSYRELMRP
jgi:4'-phosphopantetheinyl transferase